MKKLILSLTLFLAACASTTEEGEIGLGRKQLLLVPTEQIMALSEQGYADVKTKAAKDGKLDTKPALLQRLQTISARIIPQTAVFRKDALDWKWEVHAITSDELNAFCMPGGKIIFYTAIVEKLQLNDAEIAAIMGHEIAHALREHSRERMSEEMIKQVGLGALVATKTVDAKYANAANLLTSLTVSLPHGRNQESEADEIGVELMARAGYDPQSAVTLWQKMESAGGSSPPEILSTHPSSSRRIKEIQELVPKVTPLYKKAKS